MAAEAEDPDDDGDDGEIYYEGDEHDDDQDSPEDALLAESDDDDDLDGLLSEITGLDDPAVAEAFATVLCNVWSAVSVLFFAFAYYVGGVTPRWTDDLTSIGFHAGSAIMLIFSAFVLELGFLWTGLMFAQSGEPELRKSLRDHRLADSCLTLLEYAIKFVTGRPGR
eukprot:Skav229186  [mRNA]  locus=scaffold1004:312739:322685:- [translate_table: standard]